MAATSRTVGTGALCGVTLTDAQYHLRHTYLHGVRARTQYLDALGAGIGFFSNWTIIDPNTGLPSAGRDVSELQTDYEFDHLGRLAWIKPAAGHDAWIEYKYTNGNASNAPARAEVIRRENGSETGTVRTREEFLFRRFRSCRAGSRRLKSGNVWTERDTEYDAQGRRTKVSEWALEGAGRSWTEYRNYDAFDRPRTIRPPDGSTHDIFLEYLGTRQVKKKVKIGTARSGGVITESTATSWERYDIHGRLWRVVEPSGTGGGDVTTTYDYDVFNGLSSASTVSGATTQTRTFARDRRGLLVLRERTPKSSGTVTRSRYDARGNTGRTFDGLHDLTHVRDRAARVTAIQRTSNGKVLKGYKYGTDNVGANRVLGKIEEAWRIQYNINDQPTVDSLIFTDGFEIGNFSTWSQTIPTSLETEPVSGLEFLDEFPETLVDVEIREKYAYAGLGGRPSSRETKLTLFVGGGPVSTAEKFVQGWTYTDLGNIDKLDYPRCDFAFCTDDAPRPPPSIDHNYARGELRKVVGYTNTMEYHPNGLLHKLPHDNGVTDTQTIAANGMARPLAIQSAIGAASPLWSTGNFSFDGAGNITEIGASWFLYDKVSRLKQAAISTNQNGGGQQIQQSYGFDAFGNLLSMAGTSPQSTPTSASTNRLSGGSYDNAGNLVEWEAGEYIYDEFNQMVRMKSGPREWIYVYTVDGERIWQFKVGAEPRFDRWTLRDLDGQVLRIYEVSGGSDWEVDTDYIYRNGSLLAAETRDGERHFHLDHLGTPRLITGPAGGQVAYHAYLPFGEEVTNPSQDDVALKFTGHERDSEGDGLDYMHARHCGPQIGRFTSVDPVGGRPAIPQSWNRYSYVRNNPVIFFDPNGEELRLGKGNHAQALAAIRLMVRPENRSAIDLAENKNGETLVTLGASTLPGDTNMNALREIVESTGVTAEINLMTDNQIFEVRDISGNVEFATLAAIDQKGLVLPNIEIADRGDLRFSTQPGLVEVIVNGGLSSETLAAVIAAELGAHVLRITHGFSASFPSEQQHRNTERLYQKLGILNSQIQNIQ